MAADILNRRFGKLTVVERKGSTRTGRGKAAAMWRCRCDCGSERFASSQALVWGGLTSCGCSRRAKAALGHCLRGSRSLTYRSWESMIARCFQKSNPAYEHYRKRGISVCERWRAFAGFLADMGQRPSAAMTIERMDNGKGYEPGNCKWATRLEQSNNTSAVTLYEYRGGRYSISALSRVTGVPKQTLRYRLASSTGWTVEGAVNTPPIPRADRYKKLRA